MADVSDGSNAGTWYRLGDKVRFYRWQISASYDRIPRGGTTGLREGLKGVSMSIRFDSIQDERRLGTRVSCLCSPVSAASEFLSFVFLSLFSVCSNDGAHTHSRFRVNMS